MKVSIPDALMSRVEAARRTLRSDRGMSLSVGETIRWLVCVGLGSLDASASALLDLATVSEDRRPRRQAMIAFFQKAETRASELSPPGTDERRLRALAVRLIREAFCEASEVEADELSQIPDPLICTEIGQLVWPLSRAAKDKLVYDEDGSDLSTRARELMAVGLVGLAHGHHTGSLGVYMCQQLAEVRARDGNLEDSVRDLLRSVEPGPISEEDMERMLDTVRRHATRLGVGIESERSQ